MNNIYGEANKYKTTEERLLFLSAYHKNLLLLLKEGFNPFEDNSALIAKLNAQEKKDSNKLATNQQQKSKNQKLMIKPFNNS